MALREETDNDAKPATEPKTKEPVKSEASVPAETTQAAPPAEKSQILTPLDQAFEVFEPGVLGFGSVPRITVSNGQIADGEGNKLGTWLELEVESFNDLFMVATGDNSEEAKEFLKFSYDPDVHADGTSMQEYVREAKDAGYKKAELKRYIELFGTLTDSEKDCDELKDELVMLSLSPQSVGNWNSFRIQSAHKVKRGKLSMEDLKSLKVSAKVRSFKNFTFSVFDFAVA